MEQSKKDTILRAERILETWPDWKRGYQLTPFSSSNNKSTSTSVGANQKNSGNRSDSSNKSK